MSDIIIVNEENGFTDEEIRAYERHLAQKAPSIAASAAIDFFKLYLEGYTLKQIHKQYKSWKLGAFVDARVRFKWDEKKDKYLEELEVQVMERMGKIKLESLNFLADMAAVAHSEFRDEMIKYLQNPQGSETPKNRIKSIREYKELMNVILALSGMETNIDGPDIAIQVNAGDGSSVGVAFNSNDKARLLAEMAEEEDNE